MLKQCRLCFKQAQETISIYGISNGMLVANMIDSVIPELVIEDNEKLKFSSEICNCCLEIISSACELRKISIENDQKLKEAAIQPEIKTEIQTQFIKCEPDSDNDDDSFYQQDAVSCASTTNKQPSKVTKPKPPAVTVDRSNSLDRKRGRPRKLKEKSQVPGGRRFCTICKKKFKSIKLHKFIHVDYVEEYQEPGPTILTCPLCLYQTLNKEEIEIHLNTHENDFDSNKTLPCLKCTSAFTTFEAFIKHSKKHNAIFTHRCLKCLKRFEFGETLLRHLQHHSYYTCDYCGLSNKRKEKVQEHILGVHFSIKSHLCPTCGISFTTGGGLRLHLETCNQEVKKFKCKLCPKSFSQLGALNRHQSVHVTDATIQCDQCPKKFKAYRNLIIHKAHHDPSKINLKFSCEYCEMRFNTKYKMNRHLLTHTGVKPYVCPAEGCDRAFAQSGDLNKHLRVHVGENTYACEHEGCTMRFKLKSELRLHQDQHYLIQNTFAQ